MISDNCYIFARKIYIIHTLEEVVTKYPVSNNQFKFPTAGMFTSD